MREGEKGEAEMVARITQQLLGTDSLQQWDRVRYRVSDITGVITSQVGTGREFVGVRWGTSRESVREDIHELKWIGIATEEERHV